MRPAIHRKWPALFAGEPIRAKLIAGTNMLPAVVKSLFFSYAMGIVLLIVAVRYFGRAIGVTKVYTVGMLRYFVV